MLNSEEIKQVGDWRARHSGTAALRLLSTKDRRTAELKQFCDILAECAPGIRIITETAENGELPFIEIRQTLRYQAVPLGRELAPFLEALAAEDSQPSALLKKHLDQIRMPAHLRLHIGRHCPFCPQTVRQMLPMIRHGDRIRLTVIDAELFPEMAAEDQIRSVPTLVLDENFRWTGTVRPEEVARILADRDPACLTAESMEQMLREGRAARLAEMMRERGMIFPAFPDLLCHEKWPVRLGAMVVAETLAESRVHLTGLTGALWERFAHADEKARGDILYVIGIGGGMEDIPHLEEIEKTDSSADVREAAAEAVSQIFTKDMKEETWAKSE